MTPKQRAVFFALSVGCAVWAYGFSVFAWNRFSWTAVLFCLSSAACVVYVLVGCAFFWVAVSEDERA